MVDFICFRAHAVRLREFAKYVICLLCSRYLFTETKLTFVRFADVYYSNKFVGYWKEYKQDRREKFDSDIISNIAFRKLIYCIF